VSDRARQAPAPPARPPAPPPGPVLWCSAPLVVAPRHLHGQEVEQPPVAGVEHGCEVEQHPDRRRLALVVLCVATHLDDARYHGGGGGRVGGGARSDGGSGRGGRDWIAGRSTGSAEGNTVGTSSPMTMVEMRSGVLEFVPVKGSMRHATHVAAITGEESSARSSSLGTPRWRAC
jgi:hypothetical protein